MITESLTHTVEKVAPTLEIYNYYKNNKPKKRKMKGSRLSRIKEIDACLNEFPEENPFIKDLTMGEFKIHAWSLKDENGREKFIDSAPHTKVYRVGINKRILYQLPNAAHALLNWIILNQNGNGYVFLNEEKIKKEMAGFKHHTTFHKRAVESLINAGIIAEYHKPYYLLNPRFFHFGSRINSYPHCITFKPPSIIEIEEEDF